MADPAAPQPQSNLVASWSPDGDRASQHTARGSHSSTADSAQALHPEIPRTDASLTPPNTVFIQNRGGAPRRAAPDTPAPPTAPEPPSKVTPCLPMLPETGIGVFPCQESLGYAPPLQFTG